MTQPTLTFSSPLSAKLSLKSIALIALSSGLLVTSGCQSLRAQSGAPTSSTAPSNGQASDLERPATPAKLDNFMINGKIGITTPASDTQEAQAGSAFYAWGQQNERFAIELIGALGIGKTNIEYDGQTATLVSEKAGTLTASSPDELLKKATGWQVPISQLPYWISGHPTPSDSDQKTDANGRLIEATNSGWTASFTYAADQTLPNKLTARHSNGHKVVMTINHQTTTNR